MKDFLTRHIGWRLLSLAVAVGIWMTVASEPEMSTIVSVPVQYKEPGNRLEISSRVVDHVDLEARGPSGRLRDVAMSRTAVVLDLSGVREPGERTFTITREDTNLPRGIELVRAIPAQVRFEFERRGQRKVPVHVRFSGAEPAHWEVVPDHIMIIGPESKVGRVDFVSTDPVTALALARTGQITSAVYLPEAQVRFVSRPVVTVKVK